MKDRIPRYPGRVRLAPSADGEDFFTLTRADDPEQAGTPLNKASLLSDAVAEEIGLTGSDPTVSDALGMLARTKATVRGGAAAPGTGTAGQVGDLYVHEDGDGRRHVFVCGAVGNRPVDLDAEWERGGITTSGISAAANYRVRSRIVDIPGGTVLSIASGFRFALYRFNDAGEYMSVVSLRTADYTVSADMRFRILIARVTEDTSESADVAEFSSALSATSNGVHWSLLAAAREVRKTAILTSSQYWDVPRDLIGEVSIRAFGGGAGGGIAESGSTAYGGGGGHMALWTGPLTAKRYEVRVGAGGEPGQDGGTTSFGSLVSAAGGSGSSGGSGGGNGGNGSYGGGGGGYGPGGNGGTYGGGGGGGSATGVSAQGYAGGSGRAGQYSGGSGATGDAYRHGGGGGGYSANGAAATSSAGGKGGAGFNTVGFGLDFEGTGAAGTDAGGGGGYGGPGGNGYRNGANSHGGGGGGYGAKGGNGSTYSGGGGGGFGGPGGDASGYSAGGGGGYGLSGAGGSAGSRGKGGIAAGGAGGYAGGDGVVIITYTGVEVV